MNRVSRRLRTVLAAAVGALLMAAPGLVPNSSAATAPVSGYWMVGEDGGIFSFGDSPFLGSTGAMKLNQPIVGMGPTLTGGGYWLVASDGGIFSFGDAAFYGSTGAIRLNQPITGMAPTPAGRGYWLVATDGGIFSFGDAAFYGSTGAIKLNRAIVGMAATPTGKGYWLVAADGGVFSFGDAAFHGAPTVAQNVRRAAALVPTATGRGYWISTASGKVYNFGDAPSLGQLEVGPPFPIVGMAGRSLGKLPVITVQTTPTTAAPTTTTTAAKPTTTTTGPTTTTTSNVPVESTFSASPDFGPAGTEVLATGRGCAGNGLRAAVKIVDPHGNMTFQFDGADGKDPWSRILSALAEATEPGVYTMTAACYQLEQNAAPVKVFDYDTVETFELLADPGPPPPA